MGAGQVEQQSWHAQVGGGAEGEEKRLLLPARDGEAAQRERENSAHQRELGSKS